MRLSAAASLVLMTSLVTTSQAFNVEALHSVIDTSFRCRTKANPGLAISVVKGGKTLLSRGYGFTDVKGTHPVTSSTKFNVASLTKAFTAALMLKVLDETGRYNLSTRVKDIVGNNFRFADDLRTEHATVEDLLAHKMAIPANSRMRFDSKLDRKSIFERVQHLKSYDTFRTTFIYSNIMYGLASSLTEQVGGERWEELMRRHLFQPLGMKQSTFTTEADLGGQDAARPYKVYEGNLQPLSLDLPRLHGELTGSGSLVTTAEDMTRWMNFHLTDGLGGRTQRVMKEELVQELHKPRTAIPRSSMPFFLQPAVPVTTSFDLYALGWWNGYYRGYPIWGHSGASYGYCSFIVLVPHLKAGVFVALNGEDESYLYRGPLLNLVLDHLLEITPSWVNASLLCTFPAPYFNVSEPRRSHRDPRQPLAHNLSAYLGVYENPAYGRIEVRLAEEVDAKGRGSRGGTEFSRRLKHQISSPTPSSPQLTLLYGYGRWDLLPQSPRHAAFQVSARSNFDEYFYGVGRGVTAFVDFPDFIFHPPSARSDVVEKLSAPGMESRLPPVFQRVTPARNDVAPTLLQFPAGTVGHVFLACVLSMVLKCR